MKIKLYFLLFIIVCNISFSNEIVNIDENKIKLEADEITIYKDKNEIKLKGNVVINSGNVNLYADHMKVDYYENNKQNEIKEVSGNGNVLLKNENIDAKSNKFSYKPNKNTITMFDNVVVQEQDSVVYGDSLTYNIITGDSSINSKKEKVKIIINDIDSLKNRYDK